MVDVTDIVSTDLLIVGAGPGGSTAAIYAARQGLSTLLIDAAEFPRDKTCGDGLTPRAIHQLRKLGLADDILRNYTSHGLKLHGFGGSVTAPWADSAFGPEGSAMPRTELDNYLVQHAASQPEVTLWQGAEAGEIQFANGQIEQVHVRVGEQERVVKPRVVIVADGVRSTFGKRLGREWHRGEVYGIAARSYCPTPLHDEPWIHSHLELRDSSGAIQPGYGWIFPLANGRVNLGCGALSTDERPARINTKKLLRTYADSMRDEWKLGEPTEVASALLPMGGAVSGVAGPNWMLIGDAAACVNPLNGEGIDYGMETAELAVELAATSKDFSLLWPHVLRTQYGDTFQLARTLARALTYPQFLPMTGPLGLNTPLLMRSAARLMGNLVTEEDNDIVARLWRTAGRAVAGRRGDAPLWS
ncbi:geranylgeranyl reductase family protein [Corynebacterium epidermidicanis]|uniref:Geranylgeranyl reductase family protein n=1 Tax=Corynebacterium epidermidicanis TaxID=1050174 RepID=A0A0G3GTU3_9CORY|nr:geranylgeranyl reductase family protein [Corynebacterium epidermidicanis]AKK02242.1 geranylgeranyl reductase family protein [Corynebacterium epidermidicanis]